MRKRKSGMLTGGYPGAKSFGTFCHEKEIPVLVMSYGWVSSSIMEAVLKK